MKFALGVMVILAASACALAQGASNPVVASAKEIFQRQAGYLVAAAEEMPANKYGYRPTAGQRTYGEIVSHIVHANFGVCGMLSGNSMGKAPAVSGTTPKNQLVPVLKQSFEACRTALDGLKDSSLGQTITFFRGAKRPRARALFELTGDLEDHYSQMASYLRLNGMLPPSAKK